MANYSEVEGDRFLDRIKRGVLTRVCVGAGLIAFLIGSIYSKPLLNDIWISEVAFRCAFVKTPSTLPFQLGPKCRARINMQDKITIKLDI